jgi:hypothetical protein
LSSSRNFRIERAERLVEQEDRRIGRQGSGDHDALRLAAGQLGREAIIEAGQMDEIDHLRDHAVHLCLRHPRSFRPQPMFSRTV